MKKNNYLLLKSVFLAFTLVFVFSVFVVVNNDQAVAQEDEQTAQETPAQEATTSATTSSLKDRIEKVVEEKETQNGSVAGQIDYSTRAIIGTVDRVSESSITVQTLLGSVIIPITENVELTDGKKEIKVAQIEIDNSIIALGLQAGESFTPIKIIIYEKEIMPRPQVVTIGAVKETLSNSISVESRLEGLLLKFSINNNTNIIDSDNEEVTVQNLFEDVQVVIAGYHEEDGDTIKNTAQIVKALVSLD